jgi:hypothetical protein
VIHSCKPAPARLELLDQVMGENGNIVHLGTNPSAS